jgi:hypothetical protein
MNKNDSQVKDSNDGQSPSINIEGVDDRQQKDGVTLEEDFGCVFICLMMLCSTDNRVVTSKPCPGYANLDLKPVASGWTDLSRLRVWSI